MGLTCIDFGSGQPSQAKICLPGRTNKDYEDTCIRIPDSVSGWNLHPPGYRTQVGSCEPIHYGCKPNVFLCEPCRALIHSVMTVGNFALNYLLSLPLCCNLHKDRFFLRVAFCFLSLYAIVKDRHGDVAGCQVFLVLSDASPYESTNIT